MATDTWYKAVVKGKSYTVGGLTKGEARAALKEAAGLRTTAGIPLKTLGQARRNKPAQAF